MSSTLTALLNDAELERISGGYTDWETNWCGTRVPGLPRPKGVLTLTNVLDAVALNPQPLPPQSTGYGMTFSF